MHQFGLDVNVFYAVLGKRQTMGGKEKDFNNVREWLHQKLAERKLSTNRFALLTGNKITNASIFRWYSDTFRPTAEKMQIVCETLSRLPILEEGEQPRYEEVPLREGLSQFTEKPRTDRVARR